MVDSDALKTAVPYDSVEPELMFHPFKLIERTRAVQRFHNTASHRKTSRVALSISRHRVIAAHRVFDAVRLNIAGGCQECRRRDAVRIHDPHTVSIVALLPTVAFLQATARQRAEMVVNIEYFHRISTVTKMLSREKLSLGCNELRSVAEVALRVTAQLPRVRF